VLTSMAKACSIFVPVNSGHGTVWVYKKIGKIEPPGRWPYLPYAIVHKLNFEALYLGLR